jgi:ankyrin repeat protein
MQRIPLIDALEALGPGFLQEVRKRVDPVKDQFFQGPPHADPAHMKDGLIASPPYLSDPRLRKVAIELAELALENGIDVNLACEPDGSTFLHMCVLLRDPIIAAEAVAWLLAHGADSNKVRDDGESPLSLAIRLARTDIVELMRGST